MMNSKYASPAKRNIAKWILLLPVAAFAAFLLFCTLRQAGKTADPKYRTVADTVALLSDWGAEQGYLPGETLSNWRPGDADFRLYQCAADFVLASETRGDLNCTVYTFEPSLRAMALAIEIRSSDADALLSAAELVFSTYTPWLAKHPDKGVSGCPSYRSILAAVRDVFSETNGNDTLFFFHHPAAARGSVCTPDGLSVRTSRENGNRYFSLRWNWAWT